MSFTALRTQAEQPAAQTGHVETLLETRTEYQWTPLHWAARRGDLNAVRNLAGTATQREARDLQGRTPLHIAALSGHGQVVEYLLQQGAEVNARDQWGITPLRRMELIRETRGWNRSDIKDILRRNGGTT